MKLTVVGCAPAYTRSLGRASSCYLVEHGATAIALDLGQGAFSSMSAYRSPETLNAVFITHLHADHNVDLIPLRHFVRYENGGRGPQLHGPADLRARFSEFQGRYGEASAQPDFLSDLPGASLEAGALEVGGLTIEARRVTHIPDSFAFRIAVADGSGAGLVYSGDCGVAEDLLPLIRVGDTMLCEAAFGVERPIAEVHLTAQEAGAIARLGGAERLVLTHILDRNQTAETIEVASAAFGREVQIAEPGMTVDIG